MAASTASISPGSITLADRVTRLKPSATLAVTQQVREMKAAGHDVIGFGVGEPDFDTPDFLKEVAITALRDGRTKYAPVPGDMAAREAIAHKLGTENGISCTPEDICISVGAKHSLYLAIQCLVNPGDQVLIPTPAWVSYRPMVELAGGEVIELPGAVENDFRVTATQLEAAISPQTRLLIMNTPSNPCGTMYTPDDIAEIAAVLERHPQVVLLCDEIYEKLIFGGIEHRSPGSIDAIAARVVTINGLSKAYAMTGWRIGYACAPGGVAKAMAKIQGQMTSSITAFCYPAIAEALTHGGDDVERMRQTFAERAVRIHELVSQWPDVKCPKPTGAFYVFPDIGAHFGRTSPGGRRIENAVDFASALLTEAGVALVPGDDFGDCARTHVRLSFACSTEVIEAGCGRIEDWLNTLT